MPAVSGCTMSASGAFDDSGYECMISTAPDFGAVLFQGCEAPLDHAQVTQLALGATPLVKGTETLDFAFLGNRRPNLVTTSPVAPNTLFVGVEGGLVSVPKTGSPHWVYKSLSTSDPAIAPYLYIKSVWVDPADPKHLEFSGAPNGEEASDIDVLETFDEGLTVNRVATPTGIAALGLVRFSAGAARSTTYVLSVERSNTLPLAAPRVLVREHSR